MSSEKDAFVIMVEEIGVIRRQIETLQRTSLNKGEAEDFNTAITGFLTKLADVPKNLHQAIQRDLAKTVFDVRAHAVEVAENAAREAIERSHAESLKAAKSLSQAAGEARRQAWRYFGGFWVWLASIGAAGALIGALAVFWLQGRADAKAFGQYPSIYCRTAGGEFADQRDGSRYCIFMVSPPTQPAGE